MEKVLDIEMQLTELEFSDLLDLAEALAVPVISSITESSYEGLFSLLGIELPERSSWCFQDIDASSDSEQMQAQAFEQCEQTASDLISKKILVSMLINEDAVKSLLDTYSCIRYWEIFVDADDESEISEVCDLITNA